MKCLRRMLVCLGLLVTLARLQADQVALIDVEGTINPTIADFIARSVEQAAEEGAECLVVRLDTPGGLLESTKDIVLTFYESNVPVVVYVAPSGANATSAGCFITLAADVAAMAPNTSIGAAHPVSLGGGGGEPSGTSVMEEKLENYAVSYIEAIAEKRGRNVEWARASVRDSASITAETALATNVIDLIARDVPDLLGQLQGRTVGERTLKTGTAEVVVIPMTMSEKVFHMMWRPEVLMILTLIAIYGIIGEISNPGGIIPGVVGVVALVLVLYMSAVLPVNVAGFALVVLAVGLFIAEAFTPTNGVLTGGGVVSFFFGLLLLFDRANPAFRVPMSVIISATAVTALFFTFVVAAGLRAQSLRTRVGRESMVGEPVSVVERVTAEHGRVFVEGEYWNAVSETPIEKDEPAEIVGIEGLLLKVKRTTTEPGAAPGDTSKKGKRP